MFRVNKKYQIKRLLSTAVISFCLSGCALATTYYVAAGETSVDVASATSIDTPCGFNAVWDDMCAGTTIGDGDIIELADGAYDNTTYDVPDIGLGNCVQNIDLTIQGASNDPKRCIIDFTGNDYGVDGFHITSTGTWLFKGLTIHGSGAWNLGIHPEGEITFIDGTLQVYNCIIYNDTSRGEHGIAITSHSAAASALLYNTEIYDTANDALTANGSGGVGADRIIEAYYSYFHDIDTATFSNAITSHCDDTSDEATIKAYFCTFKNIGHFSSGAAIGVGIGTISAYVYNCVFEDCCIGVLGTNIVEVKNCTFKNIYQEAIIQSTNTAEVTIENCLIWKAVLDTIRPIISATGGGNVSIKSCAMVSNTVVVGISTLEDTAGYSNNIVGKSLTVEDCLIYTPYARGIKTKHQTLNCRRNLIWGKTNGSIAGIVHNYFFSNGGGDPNRVTLNLEHNSVHNVNGTQPFSTASIEATAGANTADVILTTIGNTYDAGSTYYLRTKDSGIAAGALDQASTITWRDFSREIMLSPDSTHYRDKGAAMMPGWYRPEGNLNMGAFCRGPIEDHEFCFGDQVCEKIASDINCDCVVDFLDFAILASQWLDCTLISPETCWE